MKVGHAALNLTVRALSSHILCQAASSEPTTQRVEMMRMRIRFCELSEHKYGASVSLIEAIHRVQERMSEIWGVNPYRVFPVFS